MESSSSTSLDVKVISCKDLKSFNFFQKLSVYSLVSLGTGDGDGDDDASQRRQKPHRTPTDRVGDRNPEWNHQIRFDLDRIPPPQRHLLFLDFNLFTEGMMILGGDKPLGKVHVPLADLVGDGDDDDAVRFVSYQIRSPDGKPNGILNFSYKVVDSEGKKKKKKENIATYTAEKIATYTAEKIATYPAVDASPALIFQAQGGYFAPPVTATVPFYSPPAPISYYPPPPGPVGFPPGGFGYAPSHVYPTVQNPGVEGPRPYGGDSWQRGWDGSRGF